jgi:hypothetical protein
MVAAGWHVGSSPSVHESGSSAVDDVARARKQTHKNNQEVLVILRLFLCIAGASIVS